MQFNIQFIRLPRATCSSVRFNCVDMIDSRICVMLELLSSTLPDLKIGSNVLIELMFWFQRLLTLSHENFVTELIQYDVRCSKLSSTTFVSFPSTHEWFFRIRLSTWKLVNPSDTSSTMNFTRLKTMKDWFKSFLKIDSNLSYTPFFKHSLTQQYTHYSSDRSTRTSRTVPFLIVTSRIVLNRKSLSLYIYSSCCTHDNRQVQQSQYIFHPEFYILKTLNFERDFGQFEAFDITLSVKKSFWFLAERRTRTFPS